MYGTVPFKGADMKVLHSAIISGQYELKDEISNEAWDLIKWILEVDPEKWITTDEILEHKWLSNAKEDMNDIFTETEKDKIRKEFTY